MITVPYPSTVAELQSDLTGVRVAEIERRNAIVNPYDFLVDLQAGHFFPSPPAVIARARAPWYPRFLELTAPYPAADQDMLVRAAARVFKVRVGTLRRDLATAVTSMTSGVK